MADIKYLALRAKAKLDARDAISEADAISKAIRGAGITHSADHKRLMREVGAQFARDKRDAVRIAGRSRRRVA